MKPTILTLAMLASNAVATPRTSTDYSIAAETLDFGGHRAASANYTNDGSITPVTDISSEATTATVAKHGYIGQLYDVLGFGILFTDNYPPEEGTTQVIPLRTLDDGSHLSIPLNDVVYSALNGPVASISAQGLITTSPVDEETPALIRAVLTGVDGAVAELQIFVQDTLPDNFGTYAADGLPDSWQRQYFGRGNPLASPLLDPDGDGQTNLFEYTAGLVPTDPLSRFQLRILPVPGFPSRKDIVFSPRFEDRTYEVTSNLQLSGPWSPLVDCETNDSADQRTVTDKLAIDPKKFYHVEITKP